MEMYVVAAEETHTAIEADALSEEQLYRRLKDSFDILVIPRPRKTDR